MNDYETALQIFFDNGGIDEASFKAGWDAGQVRLLRELTSAEFENEEWRKRAALWQAAAFRDKEEIELLKRTIGIPVVGKLND